MGWFTAQPGRETPQTPEEVAAERAFGRRYLGTARARLAATGSGAWPPGS